MSESDYGFPASLRTWLAEHGVLVSALVGLRGDDANTDLIVELLGYKPLLILRLSWELWEELWLEPGDDPDRLLGERVPLATVSACRRALWGGPTQRPTAVSWLRPVDPDS